MKEKFTDNLNIKSFLVAYSVATAIAYTALFYRYHDVYNKLTFLSDPHRFPLFSTVIIGVFIAVKLFLTVAFIKDKSEKATRNLTAIVETDFAFLLIFLAILILIFRNNLIHLSYYSESANQPLITAFIVTLILTVAYNILTICAIFCRHRIFKISGTFHFFIIPIHLLILLFSLNAEFSFICTYYSSNSHTKWWAILIPLVLYSISFFFLFIISKKSKLTKSFSKRILIITISLRVIYIVLWILIIGFNPISSLLLMLIMSLPFLSGSFVAKRITNKIQ